MEISLLLSQSGRYVIIFNGEIYNHKLLRQDLSKTTFENFNWKGNSDTETILACIETWGLKSYIKSNFWDVFFRIMG